MILKDNEKKLYLLIYIEKSTRKLCLYAIKNLKMKGSWDVFLFNTIKAIKRAVLTKNYLNNERRMMNDK